MTFLRYNRCLSHTDVKADSCTYNLNEDAPLVHFRFSNLNHITVLLHIFVD